MGKKKIITYVLFFSLIFSFMKPEQTFAVEGVSLFTPYTGLSVTPGETINYKIDIINSSSTIKNMSFSIEQLPTGWDSTITAGGKEVKQLSVRPNDEQSISLDVSTPLEVEKGDYSFTLVASNGSNKSRLPFVVTISEQGTLATELSSDQTNLQGHADSQFSYNVTIRNRTAEKQNYALSSQVENGWATIFKSGSDSITSIQVEPNETVDITVDVTPPEHIEAGSYTIPIKADSGNTSAELQLESVITGSYDLQLTTPDGRLSTDITAGKEKSIDLVVNNTGTAPLTNIDLSSTAPPNWDVEFDQRTIAQLAPGESQTVKATIQAADEAIAGDYVTTFTASSPEKSAEATFRISVKTSTLWGIVGIIIIAAVIFGLYYVVRKYGRR